MNIPTLCIYANDQALSFLLYKRKNKQTSKQTKNPREVLFPAVTSSFTAQQPKPNSVKEAMDLSYSTWYPAVTGCEQSEVQNSLPLFTEQLTYLHSNGR